MHAFLSNFYGENHSFVYSHVILNVNYCYLGHIRQFVNLERRNSRIKNDLITLSLNNFLNMIGTKHVLILYLHDVQVYIII